MRYEVDEATFEVSMFDDSDVKFLSQPTWPDGTAWGSVEDATSWAIAHYTATTDLGSEYIAGPSPDAPTIPRPAAPVLPEIPGVSA